MKTFYDLTDIESVLDIKIELSLEDKADPFEISFRLNDTIISDVLSKSQKWNISNPLLESLIIEIHGNPGLYKIDEISIDDFSIVDHIKTAQHICSFQIDEPFYQWKHRITGQGLLIFTDRPGIW